MGIVDQPFLVGEDAFLVELVEELGSKGVLLGEVSLERDGDGRRQTYGPSGVAGCLKNGVEAVSKALTHGEEVLDDRFTIQDFHDCLCCGE